MNGGVSLARLPEALPKYLQSRVLAIFSYNPNIYLRSVLLLFKKAKMDKNEVLPEYLQVVRWCFGKSGEVEGK